MKMTKKTRAFKDKDLDYLVEYIHKHPDNIIYVYWSYHKRTFMTVLDSLHFRVKNAMLVDVYTYHRTSKRSTRNWLLGCFKRKLPDYFQQIKVGQIHIRNLLLPSYRYR